MFVFNKAMTSFEWKRKVFAEVTVTISANRRDKMNLLFTNKIIFCCVYIGNCAGTVAAAAAAVGDVCLNNDFA